MKKGSIIILRLASFGIGLIVLALCIFALPELWKGGSIEFPEVAYVFPPLVIGLYATAVLFFIGLWQTFKLLHYIDQNKAFSDLSVTALKKIKYCALTIGVLYMGGLPLLYPIAQADDAPGILLIGFVIACAPIVIAVFAAVLQMLLHNAIEIKSENELTV